MLVQRAYHDEADVPSCLRSHDDGLLPPGAGLLNSNLSPFPLYHHRGAVAIVGDDLDYLDYLRDRLPQDWSVRCFTSSTECLYQLQQEPPLLEASHWALDDLLGRPAVPTIEDVMSLWATNLQPDLVRVLVCAFVRAQSRGPELLSELAAWHGACVLLSSPDRAINLHHNDALVIAERAGPRTASSLCARLELLLARPDLAVQGIWRRQFSDMQLKLLCSPSSARDLVGLAGRTWNRWAALGGRDWGIVGSASSGNYSWLRLVAAAELDALADQAAQDGASTAEMGDIRRGKVLPAVRFGANVRSNEQGFIPAFYLGDDGDLLGALQRVELRIPSSTIGAGGIQ